MRAFQEESARLIGEWIRQDNLDPANLVDAETIASFPGREQLQADLVDLLGGMAQFGKDQLDAELARLSVAIK